MDGDDVRVIECGHRARLAFEASAPLGVAGGEAGEYLERDATMQPRVLGDEHVAHATLTERFEDRVVVQFGDHRGRHVIIAGSWCRRECTTLTRVLPAIPTTLAALLN